MYNVHAIIKEHREKAKTMLSSDEAVQVLLSLFPLSRVHTQCYQEINDFIIISSLRSQTVQRSSAPETRQSSPCLLPSMLIPVSLIHGLLFFGKYLHAVRVRYKACLRDSRNLFFFITSTHISSTYICTCIPIKLLKLQEKCHNIVIIAEKWIICDDAESNILKSIIICNFQH